MHLRSSHAWFPEVDQSMPSSVIRHFRYRPEHEALDITFVSGRQYRYLQVPKNIYEEMRSSFSKGEYFNRHIRDHFPFEQVTRSSAR
jgi:hypothetical protein